MHPWKILKYGVSENALPARVSHLEIKVPYNVLLGDTTNGNNVSAKNDAVARLNLLGGEGGNHERGRREHPGAC